MDQNVEIGLRTTFFEALRWTGRRGRAVHRSGLVARSRPCWTNALQS